MNARERGTALLLVLWVTVLLAALLAGVAAATRSHGEAALYGSEHVRAELAAQAGLAHAVAGLGAQSQAERWIPDGRAYHFDFDGAKVSVRVVDVGGLFDLNATPPDMLQRLFVAAGADAALANQMAGTIAGWRAPPRGVGDVAHGPIRSLDQLAALPGVDAALFTKLQPAVTVFSGRNFPDASYAGPIALEALRGISAGAAETLVRDRRARPAGAGAGNGVATGAVAGGALVAGYGGTVERVFASAVLPDGTRADLDVTLRLALTAASARPYKVLDWRPASPGAP
ncbi:MAG TPA: type II secretion system protein GspK [Rhodanobacteraceae bacterium]|jgi:general secretion pathway protein K|nr:type II secretion system protein GspK [Rhodanobacteraceae bacterium]